MIIFLLFVIASILLLIYRHLTKDEREARKLEKLRKKFESKEKAQRKKEKEIEDMRMAMEQDEDASKQRHLNDLDSQISQYHKVHKTWNWRK